MNKATRMASRSAVRLRRGDRATVTAEFAVILPAVVVMSALLFSSARAVVVGMECQDAARAVAREMVVAGSPGGDPHAVASTVAGPGVSVEVSVDEDVVRVATSCPVMPGPLDLLPVAVTGHAVGVRHE